MSTFPQTPRKAFKSFLNFLYENSKPNIKYIADKTEQFIAHKRSYSMLFNQIFCFLLFTTNVLRSNGPIEINGVGLIANFLCFSSTFLMTRYHPEVHRIFVNFINISFALITALLCDEGLHGAWISTANFPMLMYVATGSLWHFGVNMTIQLVLINTVYQNPMKRTLVYMNPDELLQSLSFNTNQALVYSTVFVIFTHFLIQEAFHQANIAEKKKKDFENQKNFLLGFSHELRNLINSLMGNVSLASLETASEKAKNLLSNAQLCAEMLLHLINNILDTGKVELGDLEINLSPVKIYDTMERVWSVCSELIKNKNLRGRINIQKDIPQVLSIDHYRFTQIFLNLVGNAVKYTDVGEIEITVEWIHNKPKVTDALFEPIPFNEENEQDEGVFEMRQSLLVLNQNMTTLNFSGKRIGRRNLEQDVDERPGILKITVRDTGIGIPKEDFPKLFNKFTQATSDPSKKKLGTGLGLFISKELCQRMEGDIRVYSKKGKGSAFIFCLPVTPVQGRNAYLLDKDLIRKLIMQKHLKAMIVDDQEFNHIILREFLNRFGIEVVEVAENGLVALEKYKKRANSGGDNEERINIVTMDLTMPVMDGKTSAQLIREFENITRIDPCLMMMVSANCHQSEIMDCLLPDGVIRADAFVKKPATVDEVSKILSTYLTRFYTEQEIKELGGH